MAKTQQEFWDSRAEGYAANPIKNMRAYEMTLERARHYLDAGDKILEVGCGTGSTALLLAPAVKQIWASDVSARMIDIGRAKAEQQTVTNASFLHGDLHSDVLESEAPYDALLSFNMIHLLEDPARGIRRMHSLVKPGGIFISKTACISGVRSALRVPIMIMQCLGKAPHVAYLSVQRIERMIRDEGFDILESGHFPKQKMSHFVVARKRS